MQTHSFSCVRNELNWSTFSNICTHCNIGMFYFTLWSMISVLRHHVVILSHRELQLPISVNFYFAPYHVTLALKFHLCFDKIWIWISCFQNIAQNFSTLRHDSMASYFKGTLSCLKIFLLTGSPLKLIKNACYFTLRALFFLSRHLKLCLGFLVM